MKSRKTLDKYITPQDRASVDCFVFFCYNTDPVLIQPAGPFNLIAQT